MKEIRGEINDNRLILHMAGHIDSGNAAQVEAEVNRIEKEAGEKIVSIDVTELKYISSAGLRVILHLRKAHPELVITNASSEIYEILEMTGFTQMMPVEKAYRVVSVEGCEEIGRGANGTIYRIDKDNVVKVYNNADALKEIQHEREVARTALVLGIPTAISYDVVRVGDSYGSVFELLDAQSFSKILANEPEKMDWCVQEFVRLLKKIHSTRVPDGELPDIRETVIGWAEFLKPYLPPETGEKLVGLVKAVPQDNHMIHGDYHTKNVQLVGDEVLLIDMDTLAVGHPVFELGSIFNAFVGFSERDKEQVKLFQGFDFETSQRFWHKVLAGYFETDDENRLRDAEDKARLIGYTRLMRREIRRGGMDSETGRANIAFWQGKIVELTARTASLLFETPELQENVPCGELDIEATDENLPAVIRFVSGQLEKTRCTPKVAMQIEMAVEEIFVNIAHYAYAPEVGKAQVRVEIQEDPLTATITFIDRGKPYDPLAKADPDITLSAEERDIGGLGIFMVKQAMDDVAYEYKDGKNILRVKKKV